MLQHIEPAASTAASSGASFASCSLPRRLSLLGLAVVERQLILQSLDMTSLAHAALTCRRLCVESLHKEVGKFICKPPSISSCYPVSITTVRAMLHCGPVLTPASVLCSSLNLTQLADAHFAYQESALGMVQREAQIHPFFSPAQTHFAVLSKIVEWQQRRPGGADLRKHALAAAALSSTASSAGTAAAGGLPPSSAALYGLYVRDRLHSMLDLDADVAAAEFSIRDWLERARAQMSELLCLSSVEFCPSLLAHFPSHLYLADRVTGSCSAFYSSMQQIDLPPPHNSGLNLAELESHADVLLRQLEKCSPVELLEQNTSKQTLVELMPLPRARGDVLWRVWQLLLRRHREAGAAEPMCDLAAAKVLEMPRGYPSPPAPLFFLFQRLAKSQYRDATPQRVQLVLTLLAEQGFTRDNCGNTFSWHLVNVPLHQMSPPGFLALLAYCARNRLLDLSTLSATSQRRTHKRCTTRRSTTLRWAGVMCMRVVGRQCSRKFDTRCRASSRCWSSPACVQIPHSSTHHER